MSISPINSNSQIGLSGLPQSGHPRRKDLKSLVDALQSGDMSAAQTAFAQMLKDNPKLAAAVNGSSSSSTSSDNPKLADFQSLSAALKSGDLSSAQKALSSLFKDAAPTAGGQPPYHALAGASGMS